MPVFPVLAQIYLLCTGIGCLSVTFAALSGALNHGQGGDGGHGGHAGHGGHGHSGGQGHGHGADTGAHGAQGQGGHGQGGHGHGGHGQGGHGQGGHGQGGHGQGGHGQGGHGQGHGQGHDGSGHDGSDNARLTRVAKSNAVGFRRGDLPMTVLTLFNPTNAAVFATWFGATGIILWRALPIALEWTLPLAILGGLGGARLTLNLIGWLTSRMHESGSFSIQDVIGLEAEVTVAPNGQGMGEIVYVKGGTRYTASARLAKPDSPVNRGTRAIICDMQDDVAYVEPWGDE